MIKDLLKRVLGKKNEKGGKKAWETPMINAIKNNSSSFKQKTKGECPNNFCPFVFEKGDNEALERHFNDQHPPDLTERIRRAGL